MKYSGNHPRFSAQDYDAKEAYNKDLTASARLHYLENDEHDKGSPARVMDEMHNGVKGIQQGDFAQFSGSKAPTKMEEGTVAYMTEDPKSYRSSLSQHWRASNPSFDMPIEHDESGRAGEGSPAMMHEGKTHKAPEAPKAKPAPEAPKAKPTPTKKEERELKRKQDDAKMRGVSEELRKRREAMKNFKETKKG